MYKVLSRKCVEGEAKMTKFQAVLIFKELAEKVFTESTEGEKAAQWKDTHAKKELQTRRFFKGRCGQYQQL